MSVGEKRGEQRGEKWLALVGIGEGGIDGLSPAARALLAQAELVVGGRRHLALAGDLAAKTLAWPSPIEGRARRDRGPPRAARLRAGERRSVLFRRRNDADAALLSGLRRSASRRPRPSRSPPPGSAGASRIARRCRCTAGRSRRSCRICSRERASSPFRGTRRRRPSSRRCSPRAGWGGPASPSARRWGARANASA